MRKVDESRAENYIKKHKLHKKWVVFALCVSLLTGSITLYMLNKPATAMTEEGAKSIGLVLDTADTEFEEGLIEQMKEGESSSEEEIEYWDENDYLEESKDSLEEEPQEGDIKEETLEESDDLDKSDSEEADSSENATKEEKAVKKIIKKVSTVTGDKTTVADKKQDVVITVLYQDKDGNALEEAKELSISESLKLKEEVKTIDGYIFTKGFIGEDEITSLIKKTASSKDASSADSSQDEEETVEAKETEVVEETVFVDAETGEEISLDEEEADEVEVVSEETVEETVGETIEETGDEEKETSSEYTYYEATLTDGNLLQVDEDVQLRLVYTKVNQKDEFEYSADGLKVKVKLSDPGAFPEGVELKVKALDKKTEGYNYDAYIDALNDNAEAIAKDAGLDNASEYDDNNTFLFDIAFMYEGQEIQPAEGNVSVSVEFTDNQLKDELAVSSQEEITLVHLPIKEEVKENSEAVTTAEATDITSQDIEVKTLTEATAEVDETEKIEFTTEGFSIYAVTVYQTHKSGTDTFESVLGDAVNFGIVAGHITLRESQTNIATKHLDAGGQFGNDITNSAEQTFIASRISGSFNVKGFPAYFITPSDYTHLVNEGKSDNVKFDSAYTSNQLDKIVDDMLLYTREASKDLASRTEATKIPLKVDRNDTDKYVLDIRGEGEGTFYFTLDNSDMDKIKAAEKLRIYKNSNQRIVFNVTAYGDLELYKYGVSIDSGDIKWTDGLFNATGDKVAQTIIWNFINAQSVKTSGSVVGVFISGRSDATWNHYSTSSGWLAFPNVNVYSGEWHNTYDKVKQISGTAQFQAYKNIDGKEATVSGFKFTLYKKNGNNWEEIETVTNDKDAPHNITFSSLTYGDNQHINSPLYQKTDSDSSFIYKIVETQGYTDENNKSYSADKTVYYAKVDVTRQTLNEITANTYFRVSAPSYYTDENCTIPISGDRPVFNNKTGGSVGFILHKYLNGKEPGTKKYSFTVKVLHPVNNDKNISTYGSLETLTDSLENIGPDITFNWEYTNDYRFVNSIFFVVTENDVHDKNVNKDNDVFVIRVQDVGTSQEQTHYYKFDYEDAEDAKLINGMSSARALAGYIWSNMTKAECHNHEISDPAQRAFYNKGKTMLRIHKMVVNEFGSKLVRDGSGTQEKFNDAILSNVVFKITNQSTGKYVVFQGFTSDEANRLKKIGYEHNADHSTTGVVYDVTYNQKAQWTITGLPEGDYTVEEVADGLTLGYDENGDYSYIIEKNQLSRVTKYDVTEDEECPTSADHGEGGRNYRVVFSADLDNHNDDPPTDVTIGGAIQTVQVCNYYSAPTSPLQVTKKFFGSTWTSDMTFLFNIEAMGYRAWDTAGKDITYPSGQPMPENTQVSVTGDGTNVRTVDFGKVPFRFEGEYKYKVTEINNAIPGVTYDGKTIYIKVDVSKKETSMHKYYGSVTNPRDYGEHAERNDENFFYLAADVTYATDESFSEDSILAKCVQRIAKNPSTGDIIQQKYEMEYTYKDALDAAFNNTISGSLSVHKNWKDINGNDIAAGRTSLTLYIWQRTVGETDWKAYDKVNSIQLTPNNNWSFTLNNLPLEDENGVKYEYCVKEPDEHNATYQVVYRIGDAEYYNNGDATVTIDGTTYKDPGYSMVAGTDAVNFGNVEITNTSVVSNKIPSTGGIGTSQFAAFGALLIAIALSGFMLSKRRKTY